MADSDIERSSDRSWAATKMGSAAETAEVPVHEVELNDNDAYPPTGPPQKLERYIQRIPSYAFDCILMSSWEVISLTFQISILNGGPVSLLYGGILASIGEVAVAASLAELASIDPTVGAQYRWSGAYAPFAPAFWALVQGWLTAFAWVCGTAGPPALMAQILVALASFAHESYVPKAWHSTMIMWATILIGLIVNLWFRRFLNAFEVVGVVVHFVFFVVSIAVLLSLARKSSNEYVWTTLTTGASGWNNAGVCFGLGLLPATFALAGPDGVLHMSDEVKDARRRLPQGMLISVVSSALMMISYSIVLLYCIGDVDKIADSALPLIEVYFEATGSKAGTVILVLMHSVMVVLAMFNALASISRLIWAFARDKGLPFSQTLSQVNTGLHLPLNSLLFVVVLVVLISILYIISTTAFNAIISLQTLGFYWSYVPPILFVLIRKLQGNPPAYGPYQIGRGGALVNIFALAYLVYILIWMPFPTDLPVTGGNMNYAGPILGAVLVIAMTDYIVSGRKRFTVPMAPKLE